MFFIVSALIILILSSVSMPIAPNKRNLKDSRVWPIYFLKKKYLLLFLTFVYKKISISRCPQSPQNWRFNSSKYHLSIRFEKWFTIGVSEKWIYILWRIGGTISRVVHGGEKWRVPGYRQSSRVVTSYRSSPAEREKDHDSARTDIANNLRLLLRHWTSSSRRNKKFNDFQSFYSPKF